MYVYGWVPVRLSNTRPRLLYLALTSRLLNQMLLSLTFIRQVKTM